MRMIFLLFLAAAYTGCHPSETVTHADKRMIEGIWLEKWIGAEADVHYIDTISIRVESKKVMMKCVNNASYVYDSIFIVKNEFRFRMENTSDPKEKFYVYYTLNLDEKKKNMEGLVRNSRGQADTVSFTRLKRK